jgi:hypothetical protein
MSQRSHITLLGAGLLALGGSALAQSPVGPDRMMPPENRSDLKTQLEKHFDTVDANHDGALSVEERKAGHARMRDEMRERVFARLDTDRNGSISKSEFEARPPRDHQGGAVRGPGMRHGGMHGHMGGAMVMHRELAAYKDKPIPKTTFVNAGLGLFDRVDINHDGKISPAERDAARKAMRDRPASANRPSPPPPGL